MKPEEIAMQLTLKAIECSCIMKKASVAGKTGQEYISEINEHMALEIGKYYNVILSTIKNSDDFGVQA